jgi:hypothetical protein
MNWQPYPQTKPPKAGEYLAWEVFNDEAVCHIGYYTKRDGFCDENGSINEWVTHWCEIVPPSASATFGAVHHPRTVQP